MQRAPHVSPTTEGLSSSIFQTLRKRAQGARAKGGRVFALDVGDTYREPPESARAETLLSATHPLVHAYAPPHGEPCLLDAIERRLEARSPPGHAPEREAIQIVSGATAGLSAACQTLLDPGEEILIPTPCWPLIPGIARSRGVIVVQAPVMTRLREPGFDLEAALASYITPRTAALYLNTPHNPTGAILSVEDLDAVARVAERHDLWILADEVYEDLWFETPPPPAPWQRDDMRARTISTHSVSKAYGMAGARVGWTHGPVDAIRALRAVTTQQMYCAPRPMQVLASRALTYGEPWLAEARALNAVAARRCADVFGQCGQAGQSLQGVPASGSFLFFDAAPFFRAGEDIEGFLSRCLDAGVLLTPGIACGRDFTTWARACFTSVSPAHLDEALALIQPVLKSR